MSTQKNFDPTREIVAVSAADDGYAMPLAVTIRSAFDHLAANRRLRLYVLDGGLGDESKARLLRSWEDPRLSVEWVRPDMTQVGDLTISHQVNTVTYLRLMMADLLPQVTRAIYLDADMLVLRNLVDLWDEPQGGHAVLATPDIGAPFLDAPATLPNFDLCRPYLSDKHPIPNFRELGLPPDARYFNGGLLVADLDQWRCLNYSAQMLHVLREHRQHVKWWDQYALNVVLAGRWRALDYRWNQGANLFEFPDWRYSPLDCGTFERLRRSPWIVHFCSPSKPWHYFNRHPFQDEFFRCLDHTDWQGWRPERPDGYLRKLWGYHYKPLRSEVKRRFGDVKRAVGGRRKAA